MSCLIYQKCGTQNHTRCVDISKLAWSLGDSVCDSLIELHTFTGCDTVSAFASQGKPSALKRMKRNITYHEMFSQVGQSLDIQPQLFERVQQLTCRMYVAASSTTGVNDLRYQLVCAKRGDVESSLLPPCRDCLFMHLLRANYHTAIWKCCLHGCPTVPDPTKCGWPARHSLDAVATSTRCCLGIVGLQVCPFLYPVSCQSAHAWQMD